MTSIDSNAIELAREPAVIVTRDLVVGVDASSVVVRLQGKGPDALYVALDAERALRIGAAFMKGALRLKPNLNLTDVENLGRDKRLKIVNGQGDGGGAP